jgi:hypothetical protein
MRKFLFIGKHIKKLNEMKWKNVETFPNGAKM